MGQEKLVSDVIYLDFSKAFDKVPPVKQKVMELALSVAVG